MAAAAGSVYEGLFYSNGRNRISYTEVALRSTLRPEYNGAVRLGLCKKNVRATMMPLYQRGWALQERVLSRRLLIYTGDQILWECQQVKEAESGVLTTGLYSMRLPAGNGDKSATAAELRECWSTLVKDFCESNISVESDKLPAVAGLARTLHRMSGLGGDEYLAGLWRSDLVNGLLWATRPVCEQIKKGVDLEVKTGLPTRYRAPSWSWAAVDGPFFSYSLPSYDGTHHRYFSVVDCFVTPCGRDELGEVSNGVLTLRGPLLDMSSFVYWHLSDMRRKGTHKRIDDIVPRLLRAGEDIISSNSFKQSFTIYFDGDSNRGLPGDSMGLSSFWFLRMAAKAFLVLKGRDEESDAARDMAYKRVGLALAMWPTSEESCDRLFENCTDETIRIL